MEVLFQLLIIFELSANSYFEMSCKNKLLTHTHAGDAAPENTKESGSVYVDKYGMFV